MCFVEISVWPFPFDVRVKKTLAVLFVHNFAKCWPIASKFRLVWCKCFGTFRWYGDICNVSTRTRSSGRRRTFVASLKRFPFRLQNCLEVTAANTWLPVSLHLATKTPRMFKRLRFLWLSELEMMPSWNLFHQCLSLQIPAACKTPLNETQRSWNLLLMLLIIASQF